jgi:dienelactone hydrolase
MIRFLFFSAIVFLLTYNVDAQNCTSNRYNAKIFSAVTTSSGVQFGTARSYNALGLNTQVNLKFDIYEPQGDTLSSRPVIIFFFGGAYLIGTRNQPPIPTIAAEYVKRGYVFISADYRIGFNTFSGGSAERAVMRAVQDQSAMLRFLVDNASTYKVDTSRIVLMGTSAGCVSALHYIHTQDNYSLASFNGTTGENYGLGCKHCAGNNLHSNAHVKVAALVNLWGAITDTNLILNAGQGTIPTISFHGTADAAVKYDYGTPFSYPVFPSLHGSKNIHIRMKSENIKNKLYPLWGAGHEPELTNTKYNDTILDTSAAFLYDIFRPSISLISGKDSAWRDSVYAYSVPLESLTNYCWSVEGGQVISAYKNNVTVKWDNVGSRKIICTKVNEIDATRSFSKNIIVTDKVTNPIPDSIYLRSVTVIDSSVDFEFYKNIVGVYVIHINIQDSLQRFDSSFILKFNSNSQNIKVSNLTCGKHYFNSKIIHVNGVVVRENSDSFRILQCQKTDPIKNEIDHLESKFYSISKDDIGTKVSNNSNHIIELKIFNTLAQIIAKKELKPFEDFVVEYKGIHFLELKMKDKRRVLKIVSN